MNQRSPGWWVTHTRVAAAESELGRDAWKQGKFPLRDGQGAQLSQTLWQNVHFISGKVPGRTDPGQVLWGSGKAHKKSAPRKHTCSRTNAARQQRSHQRMDQRCIKAHRVTPAVWLEGVYDIIDHSLQKDAVLELCVLKLGSWKRKFNRKAQKYIL